MMVGGDGCCDDGGCSYAMSSVSTGMGQQMWWRSC